MKNFKNVMLLLCLLIPGLKSSGQGYFYGIDTKYYDNTSGVPVYSNEVGEQGATDASDNLYVTGEYDRDGDPKIFIVKYPYNGSAQIKKTYNFSTSLKEHVINTFWANNQLYVVCKATSTVAAGTGFFILRYNSSLTLLNTSPSFWAGISPVKACMDASNNIYITGTTTNGSTSNSLQVMKLNSALVLQSTYNYYYTNVTDLIIEEPRDITFDNSVNSLYIAGRVYDPATVKSGVLLIKLSATLAFQWKVAPVLDINNNALNSVATYNNEVYVTGVSGANKAWRMSVYNGTQGFLSANKDYSVSGYECEGLKITVAGFNGVYAVGYAQSATLNKYKVITRKWLNSALASPANYALETMPYGSKINDALSYTAGVTKYDTYITGSKYHGGTNATGDMFLLQVDSTGSSGSVVYRDSITGRSAAGNKIVKRNAAGGNYFTVIGMEDTRTNISPRDYRGFERTYYYIIPRIGENNLTTNAETKLNLYPNPTSGIINIRNSDSIKKVVAYDLQGKVVIDRDFNDETLEQQIDISTLPNGIYFFRVNDAVSQKIVKN